ncbi:MAG: hypothetical protein K8U03_12250 [Planctomycetia bacterium]|nr:hypothetical protein [Planctomycetia bacterium]
MKIGNAIIGLAVVCMFQASLLMADIAPSPTDIPDGKSTASLEVKIDKTKDVSFLRISRSALRDAGLDIPETGTKKTGAWTPSTQRSIVAALAMSLGIAGVFLVRKKRGAAIAVALVAGAVVGTLGVQAWAAPQHDPNTVSPTHNHNGTVVIEFTDGDEGGVSLTIGTKPLPKYRRVLPPNQ